MPDSLLQTAADFNRQFLKQFPPDSAQTRAFEGSTLIPESESRFAKIVIRDFKGEVGLYRSAGRQLIMRISQRGTRRLAFSEAAFRDAGYTISTSDCDSTGWRAYYARSQGETLHVREQLREPATGRTWLSVSGWFWHATLRPQLGPWELVSVITPLEKRGPR